VPLWRIHFNLTQVDKVIGEVIKIVKLKIILCGISKAALHKHKGHACLPAFNTIRMGISHVYVML
jgi:hypothetical protein